MYRDDTLCSMGHGKRITETLQRIAVRSSRGGVEPTPSAVPLCAGRKMLWSDARLPARSPRCSSMGRNAGSRAEPTSGGRRCPAGMT